MDTAVDTLCALSSLELKHLLSQLLGMTIDFHGSAVIRSGPQSKGTALPKVTPASMMKPMAPSAVSACLMSGYETQPLCLNL